MTVTRRSAAAIGEGLAPARPARAIRAGERIHVVGIAGAGASAAALLASAAGAEVSGCDPGGPSPYTAALEAAGIALSWSHDAAHIADDRPDRLAVTKALTATQPDHPELAAARAAGLPVEAWQQTVADAATGRTLVAVAGTHGKSTSAGWLVHLLANGRADPSAFVGALLPAGLTGGVAATARIGRGPAFVVEADEYAGNFDPYRPAVAMLTSIDWDHPDVFADLDAAVVAFEAWLRAATADGGDPPTLVANVGDPGVARLVERLHDWPGRLVATALDDADPLVTWRRLTARPSTAAGPAAALAARISSAGPQRTVLEVVGLEPRSSLREASSPVRRASVALAGRHNAANGLVVAGAALVLGVPVDLALGGLASFEGVGRRLERKGTAREVVVYDDYGHHPAAIRATLAALRQREPGRRVWAVYEPLTFHRTAAMLDAFADVLAEADGIAVADIWPGRDPDTTIASAAELAAAVASRVPDKPVAAPGSVEATASWLATHVRPGDAVLVMGGGHSYRIGPRLLELLGPGDRHPA